jgi:phage I-like protein
MVCQALSSGHLPDGSVTLFVAVDQANGAATPPTEIQICPPGKVKTETQGCFLMDAQARQAVIMAFASSSRQMVIDYEHQSLTGGEAPASGWITALENRDDGPDGGLWARVTWTERGANYLRNREYRYLSPVLLIRKADQRAVRMHSVALTNTPEIQRLQPLVASARGRNNYQPEEDQMREQLIARLKLAADATDEVILAAVTALSERPTIAPELREALALTETATPSEAVATIHALKQGGAQQAATAQQLTALQTEVKVLRDAAAARTRDELVTMALSQGKITPAQREWAETYALRDPEGFGLFVAKAPVIAPVGGAVTTALKQQAGSPGLDDAQRQINRALGVTDELYLKHAPKAA